VAPQAAQRATLQEDCGADARAVVHGGALDVENHTGKSHGIMEELHFECVWLRTLWACFAPHTFKMRTTPYFFVIA
jgi:hypothetical protein